jgi:hypothetical protein
MFNEDLAGLLETLEVQPPDSVPVAEAEGAASVPPEIGETPSVEPVLDVELAFEYPEEEHPSSGAPGTGDFATDLLALGLGELPAEPAVDQVIGPPTGEAETAPEDVSFEFVPEAVLAADSPAEETGSEKLSELSDLLSSLSDAGEATEAAAEPSALLDDEPELLGAAGEEPAAGVISTDAFLADFDSSDVSFSSGLGDELTALTGGGTARTRPPATASRVPDAGAEGPVLQRDSHVDRELVMRIIDGVKRL